MGARVYVASNKMTVRLTAHNNIISVSCPRCGDTYANSNIGKLQRDFLEHAEKDHGVTSITWKGDA